jgi:two-component system, OmpR family, response regulator
VISVLLVDDDQRLRELLTSYLAENGLYVKGAPDGLAALEAMKAETFDAILLDIMMPGLDGIEVLRRIRATSTVPVIMLTARGDETDRVVGLEIGADDYVSKPFSPRELLARVRAVLRRTSRASQTQCLQEGALRVDLETREVTQHGLRVELTGLEFDILTSLLKRAGRVISREALIEETARGAINDRAIDVHVSHLRQKLGAETIRTVRGVGYVFTKAGA